MITSISMKNFKAWADTGEVRLAPLTIIFGGNSAGKTSFQQMLLLLKQTAASPDRQRVLHLGDAHSSLDLGTFEDVIHEHDVTRTIELELAWKLPETLTWRDPYHGDAHHASTLEIHTEIAQIDQRPTVERMVYTVEEEASSFTIGMERQAKSDKYRLKAKRFRPVHQTGRKWPLPAPVRFYGFPEQAIAYFQNTAFVADLNLELEQMLQHVYYLGPLREPPRRVYVWSGERPEHVGQRGERTIEALLAGRGRVFNFGYRQRTKSLEELVASQLEEMGLVQGFRPVPIAKGRKEHEVLVRTHPSAPDVRITDVGFGISQVLPVVVECFYVPKNSTIVFEQPEIHLHPKVQSALADLFIAALRARESGIERNIQILVESHSEHFLRRLQRRIAEQRLESDEVAIYFIETSDAGARLCELEIDEYGNISNWPENFFGDEMGDLMAMTEAAHARREASGDVAS